VLVLRLTEHAESGSLKANK